MSVASPPIHTIMSNQSHYTSFSQAEKIRNSMFLLYWKWFLSISGQRWWYKEFIPSTIQCWSIMYLHNLDLGISAQLSIISLKATHVRNWEGICLVWGIWLSGISTRLVVHRSKKTCPADGTICGAASVKYKDMESIESAWLCQWKKVKDSDSMINQVVLQQKHTGNEV